MPLPPISRNLLKLPVARPGRGCGFLAPAGYAWKSIGAIPEHGQIVRNRLWLHTELCLYGSFVAQDAPPPIQLNDSCAYNALPEVFVWSANNHLPHAVISRGL